MLEAALALAVTLGVALSAVEILRASAAASETARRQTAALAAAESALARIGADLPAEPGRWELRSGSAVVRVELTSFDARAEAAEIAGGLGADLRDRRDPDDENRRPLRGRPLLAIAVAEIDREGRPARARLSRVVIGPLEEDER